MDNLKSSFAFIGKFSAIAVLMLLFLLSGAWGQSRVSGELALRAFKYAFPDKVSEVVFIEGDWAIIAGGETFFWAEGRILPRAERGNIGQYAPYGFFSIPRQPVSPDTLAPEVVESIRARGTPQSQRERRGNHRGLQGILYGGLTRNQIEQRLVRFYFLGRRVTVHQLIEQPLRNVEAAVRSHPEGPAFIATLGNITGYNWREIAGTQRMSFHSWGLAVDIQPRSLGGRAIFWQWERARNEDWMLIPLERRWSPPYFVIEAFEREGFIWGGKWTFFDNMHFEFRPELHEFTRLVSQSATGVFAATLHHIFPGSLPIQ